jgi:MFS family permease
MTDAAPSVHASRQGRVRFISGLGFAQIVSWGSLYYAFPLIAEPMGRELGLSKPAVYGAATFGILVAGLASYPVGAAIDRGHGRAIMTFGSALGGALLLAWSQLHTLWAFYILFGGIGLAQAMTMYDPVFAVVTRRFGAEARRGITAITLWGGFASTVFIPLTQVLMSEFGWRAALLVLGGCNLGLCIALHAWLIDPRLEAARSAPALDSGPPSGAVPPVPPGTASLPLQGMAAVRQVVRRPAFWGLLLAFTVYYGMYVGLTLHLYPLLLERGFSLAEVISALSIIGPAQVAGRIAMWVFGRHRSVRAIGIVSIGAFPAGLALLVLLPPTFATLAGFAVICGAANGVITIVRGLVVPEMLTRDAYGAINGVLAVPANIAKALAPAATAALWALSRSYDTVLMAALVSCALVVAAFAFAALRHDRTADAA